jgi:anti-sigma factor RsiW
MVELLIDFVAGELPEEHRALVDRHLHRCPPCLAYLETYQLTIKLTRQLPEAPMPRSLHERLMACLKEIKQGRGTEGCEEEGISDG